SLTSSPCTRRCPHAGFSEHSRPQGVSAEVGAPTTQQVKTLRAGQARSGTLPVSTCRGRLAERTPNPQVTGTVRAHPSQRPARHRGHRNSIVISHTRAFRSHVAKTSPTSRA